MSASRLRPLPRSASPHSPANAARRCVTFLACVAASTLGTTAPRLAWAQSTSPAPSPAAPQPVGPVAPLAQLRPCLDPRVTRHRRRRTSRRRSPS